MKLNFINLNFNYNKLATLYPLLFIESNCIVDFSKERFRKMRIHSKKSKRNFVSKVEVGVCSYLQVLMKDFSFIEQTRIPCNNTEMS